MKLGQYPTSSDVRCYINGWWIDDLFRIEYTEQNPKVPMQGYHQKEIWDVADGKKIIVGNLIIHFRYPGYLMRAIDSIGMDRDITDASYRRNLWINETMNKLRVADAATRAKLITSLRSEELNMISPLLEQAISDPASYVSLSPVELGPSDYWPGSHGFEMVVSYGREKFTEKLQGVHLTSCQKVASSSPGGGDLGGSGQSLLEVYTFFAKKLQPVTKESLPTYVLEAADAKVLSTVGAQ
jgi:hypothetical protein